VETNFDENVCTRDSVVYSNRPGESAIARVVNQYALRIGDHVLAERFKGLIRVVLENQPSATKLKSICKKIIIDDLRARGVRPPLSLVKPHALNPREMATAIVCSHGKRPLTDCPLRADVILADHLRVHRDCDGSCYIHLLCAVARCGFSLTNRGYRHREQANHPPFVNFGQHSVKALEKQLGASDAIVECPDGTIDGAKLKTNALLSVVKSSQVLEAKLKTGIDIVDEHSLSLVNESLALPKPITVRVCLDLSGSGLNAAQPSFPFTFATPNEAASMMTPGCWMAKLDIQSEFLTIGIAYDSRRYFGFNFRDTKWAYRRCPFGGKLFPALASAFMAEVLAVARSEGCSRAIVYMDDFLVMGDTAEECQRNLDIIIAILERQGWTIAADKTTTPAQRIEFLGILFDSVTMTMSIDATKADAVLYKLDFAIATLSHLQVGSQIVVNTEVLQSLAGNLVWFSGVVTCGRLFTRPLYDLLLHRNRRLTESLRGRLSESLEWWRATLIAWRRSECVLGNVRVIPKDAAEHLVYYQGDAGDEGFGFFQLQRTEGHVEWAASSWPSGFMPDSSTEKELYTLLWALERNRSDWSNRVVVTIFDSADAALGINNGTSSSVGVWELIRRIFTLADELHVTFAALWVPRESNTFADFLTHACVMYREDHAEGEYFL
jgi:Reverse transcriptase (RNA-dependent DNA polymerase)